MICTQHYRVTFLTMGTFQAPSSEMALACGEVYVLCVCLCVRLSHHTSHRTYITTTSVCTLLHRYLWRIALAGRLSPLSPTFAARRPPSKLKHKHAGWSCKGLALNTKGQEQAPVGPRLTTREAIRMCSQSLPSFDPRKQKPDSA